MGKTISWTRTWMKNVAALWQMQTEVLAADCRHGNPAFSPVVKTPVFCRGIENIENDIESRRGWTCSAHNAARNKESRRSSTRYCLITSSGVLHTLVGNVASLVCLWGGYIFTCMGCLIIFFWSWGWSTEDTPDPVTFKHPEQFHPPVASVWRLSSGVNYRRFQHKWAEVCEGS